ncbi:MAG TPA: hypothetical protein VJK04_02430 [Candidatus Paceibacterota bacterium]
MKHHLYNLIGALYIVLSVPSVVFLIMGRIYELDPFYTVAMGGVPMGIIFLLFGTKRIAISHISNMALKFAIAALSFGIPLFLSLVLIRGGYPFFENVALFSTLCIALVSLNSFLLAIFALLRGHSLSSIISLPFGRHKRRVF